MRRACYEPTLRRLIHQQSALQPCLERVDVPLSYASLVQLLPTYVIHSPRLSSRRRAMLDQLSSVGSMDVTLVTCFEVASVASLTQSQRTCLNPSYANTSFSFSSSHTAGHDAAVIAMMPNGTLGLALKHRAAAWDAYHRRVAVAMILEDDALLPPTHFWPRLAAFRVPADADVFWLGSYSERPDVRMPSHPNCTAQPKYCQWLRKSLAYKLGTLASQEPVAPPPAHSSIAAALGERGRSSAAAAKRAAAAHPSIGLSAPGAVYRRRRGSFPHIIGAVGYLLFARALPALTREPVVAEADVSLSLLSPSPHCLGPTAPHCPFAAPPNQYGPEAWLVRPNKKAFSQGSHLAAANGDSTTGLNRRGRVSKSSDVV